MADIIPFRSKPTEAQQANGQELVVPSAGPTGLGDCLTAADQPAALNQTQATNPATNLSQLGTPNRESKFEHGTSDTKRIGVISGIVFCGFLFGLVALGLGVRPLSVFEPTCTGIVWAGVFMSGFAVGSLARWRVLGSMVAAGFCALSNNAFVVLTDFSASDSLILTVMITAVGWASARVGTRTWTLLKRQMPQDDQKGRGDAPWSEIPESRRWQVTGRQHQPWRFGIWDIVFVTCLVALVCSAIPRTQAPPVLFTCGVIALLGGVCCSWTACRWAWHDSWTLSGVAFRAGSAAAVVGIVLYSSPMPISSTLRWLMAGPVNIVAAQATAVLVCCAAVRWELRQLAS